MKKRNRIGVGRVLVRADPAQDAMAMAVSMVPRLAIAGRRAAILSRRRDGDIRRADARSMRLRHNGKEELEEQQPSRGARGERAPQPAVMRPKRSHAASGNRHELDRQGGIAESEGLSRDFSAYTGLRERRFVKRWQEEP